jgi:hypothetical protein
MRKLRWRKNSNGGLWTDWATDRYRRTTESDYIFVISRDNAGWLWRCYNVVDDTIFFGTVTMRIAAIEQGEKMAAQTIGDSDQDLPESLLEANEYHDASDPKSLTRATVGYGNRLFKIELGIYGNEFLVAGDCAGDAMDALIDWLDGHNSPWVMTPEQEASLDDCEGEHYLSGGNYGKHLDCGAEEVWITQVPAKDAFLTREEQRAIARAKAAELDLPESSKWSKNWLFDLVYRSLDGVNRELLAARISEQAKWIIIAGKVTGKGSLQNTVDRDIGYQRAAEWAGRDWGRIITRLQGLRDGRNYRPVRIDLTPGVDWMSGGPQDLPESLADQLLGAK